MAKLPGLHCRRGQETGECPEDQGRSGTDGSQSQQAEVAELEDDGIYSLERDQRQRLHELETWVTDIATAVKSSLDLCSTLRMKNAELEQRRESGPTVAPNSKMAQVFLDGLDETQRDFEHYRQQAELMHVKIHSTATLVCRTHAFFHHDSGILRGK